jgi:ABC-type glycerol-3-phosphate transport system permease component
MIGSYRARGAARTALIFCVTWLVVLVAVFPLFWAVSTSLRGNQEIISNTPTLLPQEPTLSNYQYMLKVSNFPQQFSNSTIIAIFSALSVVFFGSLGGYSLTRFRFKGQALSLRVVLLTYLFPAVLLVVPMFIIFRNLRLTDSYAALVIVHTATGLPLGLWLLRAYFQSIPIELDQAAMIDGASRLGTLWDVLLPQAIPGMISIFMFIFVFSWGDYLWPLILITSRSQMTLPLGIHTYMNDMGFEWGPLMAVTVVFALPVVILFTMLQSRLVRGLGAGAGAIKF